MNFCLNLDQAESTKSTNISPVQPAITASNTTTNTTTETVAAISAIEIVKQQLPTHEEKSNVEENDIVSDITHSLLTQHIVQEEDLGLFEILV